MGQMGESPKGSSRFSKVFSTLAGAFSSSPKSQSTPRFSQHFHQTVVAWAVEPMVRARDHINRMRRFQAVDPRDRGHEIRAAMKLGDAQVCHRLAELLQAEEVPGPFGVIIPISSLRRKPKRPRRSAPSNKMPAMILGAFASGALLQDYRLHRAHAPSPVDHRQIRLARHCVPRPIFCQASPSPCPCCPRWRRNRPPCTPPPSRIRYRRWNSVSHQIPPHKYRSSMSARLTASSHADQPPSPEPKTITARGGFSSGS